MGKPSRFQQLRRDLEAIIWNIRVKLGTRILPGSHQHVEVWDDARDCETCQKRAILRSTIEHARKLV